MADKRITDLPELIQADSGDFIPIVDSSMNVTKRVAAEKVLPNATVTAAAVDGPKTVVEFTGSNVSNGTNVTSVSGNYNFVADKVYMIIATTRLSRTNGPSTVFINMLQVDGVTITEQRLQSDQQAGDTIIGVYKPATTASQLVRLRTERITGTANFLMEEPKISIVPLVFVDM